MTKYAPDGSILVGGMPGGSNVPPVKQQLAEKVGGFKAGMKRIGGAVKYVGRYVGDKAGSAAGKAAMAVGQAVGKPFNRYNAKVNVKN